VNGGGVALPLLQLLTYGAGIVTFGFLLAAAFLDPQGSKGHVSRTGRRDLLVVSRAAAAWAVLSLLTALVTFADFLGLPLGQALAPSTVSTYFWSVPQVDALMVSALLALVIAALAPFSSALGVAAVAALGAAVGLAAPSLAVHPVSLGDHSLSMTAGALQVVAGSAWLGTLIVWCWHAMSPGSPKGLDRKGYRRLAVTCAVIVALSGLAEAFVYLSSPGQLVTTGYGRLELAKVAMFAVALLIGASLSMHPSEPSSSVRLARPARIQAAVLSAAVGVAVGMGMVALPRVDVGPVDLAEQLLGYSMPPMWTWPRVFFGWHQDTFFLVISVVSMGMYLAGVLRMRRRSNRWPIARTASWMFGILVMLWSTNAGIAAYASAVFSWHMLQHMVLSMLVPIFLVLGAPVTLALRALAPVHGSRRGPREWIVWSLDTPVVRFLTHPIVALANYTVSVYVLYFTPLFSILMENHIGHLAMQVHFLVSGYLFYWVVIGVDYAPRRLPHWGRLLLVVAALPLHAFFAVVIMLAPYPLAGPWFSQVQPPWLPDLIQDQYVAGGIAWAFGEVPTLVVLLALAAQWARSDEREARRGDRQADRDGDADLVAYNQRLLELARVDASRMSNHGGDR
jgi:putative copper resistance protein D